MAEIAGLLASGISIWELITSIKSLGDKIKCAPEKLDRYSKNLEGVYCVHSVITDVIKNVPSAYNLSVDRGGQSQNLLVLSDENLMTVTKDAHRLLRKYNLLNPNEVNTVWKRFKNLFNFPSMKERVGFVLENDLIEDLIRGVEYAKSSLDLALSIALLKGTESRDQGIRDSIQQMSGEMIAQSEALKILHRTIKSKQRSIQILPPATSVQSAPKSPSQSSRPSRKHKKERSQHCVGKANQSKRILGTAQPLLGDDVMIAGLTPGASVTNNSSVVERTIARNTELTRAGANRDKTPKPASRASPDMTTVSEDDFEHEETFSDFEIHRQVNGFIAETVPLNTCKDLSTGNLRFCIERICNNTEYQVFCLKEPCPPRRHRKHLTIEGLDGESIEGQLPCHISISYIDAWNETRSQFPNSDKLVDSSFSRCRRCKHTLVENQDNTAVQCISPCALQGSFGTNLPETLDSESDAETARTESDTEEVTSEEEQPAQPVDPEDELNRGARSTEYIPPPPRSEQRSDLMFEQRAYGVPCLPCVYCHQSALNLEQGEGVSTPLIVYGSYARSYKCNRCKRPTWITGTVDWESENRPMDSAKK